MTNPAILDASPSFRASYKNFRNTLLKARGSPGLAAQYLVAMGAIAPVCLADFAAIKVLALLALGLVAYLYWSGFSEKRAERRDRKWLESRRREFKEKAAAKPAPPH